jgi:cellulose synthase/poly-beta-1,6-N-acetylglucosamine synthase-like glycosyltransferase
MIVFLIIAVVLAVCCAVYVREILNFTDGLTKLSPGTNASLPAVTVLVPARNEERSIGACVKSLLAQDYPADKLEIIVIDDQSTDGTAEIVRSMSEKHPSLSLLRVAERPAGASPKINALQSGVAASRGEIIFTTDADCVVQPEWISSCMRSFDDHIGVVTATTVFTRTPGSGPLLYGIQFLDFLSHTACAAGAIGNGSVNNCNGSNMAYRRSAYDQAGGYAALASLNTGDDSLLAQRIAAETPYAIGFSLDPRSQVTTLPVLTWKEFFIQRMRWAAQTSDFHAETLVFLIATFIYYVILTGAAAASLFNSDYLLLFLAGWYPKLVADYLILRKFTGLTLTRRIMKYYLPAAVIHIPVIFIAVAGGYFGKFEWKGRAVERADRKP